MFTGTTKTPFSQILLLVLLAAAVAPFTLTLGHALVWDDHYIIGHVRLLLLTDANGRAVLRWCVSRSPQSFCQSHREGSS